MSQNRGAVLQPRGRRNPTLEKTSFKQFVRRRFFWPDGDLCRGLRRQIKAHSAGKARFTWPVFQFEVSQRHARGAGHKPFEYGANALQAVARSVEYHEIR